VPDTTEAVRRQETIDTVDHTALVKSYDGMVLNERVDILLNQVRAAGYNRHNIGEHAIIDTARSKKIHYFLSNLKYKKKIKLKIMAKIKNEP